VLDSAFKAHIAAEMRGHTDTMALVKHIMTPTIGFRKFSADTYVHVINASTRVYITLKGKKVTVAYSIHAPTRPSFPFRGKKQTSKKQYLGFIENKLWLPVVRLYFLEQGKRRILF
jgi:hypothetical protein